MSPAVCEAGVIARKAKRRIFRERKTHLPRLHGHFRRDPVSGLRDDLGWVHLCGRTPHGEALNGRGNSPQLAARRGSGSV